MKDSESSFSFDMERNLHPWGCYMPACLPREHLLVQEDSTHADRCLEGAFMGWHDTTPVAWMYSFRLQRVIREADPIFQHDNEYPFLDPTVVLTPGSLTADQVKQMHEQDIMAGEADDLASAVSTQRGFVYGGVQTERPELEGLRAIREQLLELLRDVTTGESQQQLQSNLTDVSNVTDLPLDDEITQPTRADLRKHYASWTNGAQIPLQAEIDILQDHQLARVLAHHRFVTHLPADWRPNLMQTKTGATIMAVKAAQLKGKHFIDWVFMEPSRYSGQIF